MQVSIFLNRMNIKDVILLDNNGDRVKNGFYRVEFFVDGEFKCQGDIQVTK